jgi:hypothetical protein
MDLTVVMSEVKSTGRKRVNHLISKNPQIVRMASVRRWEIILHELLEQRSHFSSVVFVAIPISA